MEKFCENHFVLICAILLGSLMAVGSGIGLGKLFKPLIDHLLGRVTVNVGSELMAMDPKPEKIYGPFLPENHCPQHSGVQEFITQSAKDRTELFRKVNRLDRRSAKLEVMVEMLLKARGLQVDFGKVDMKLEEDGEG